MWGIERNDKKINEYNNNIQKYLYILNSFEI